MTFRLMCMFAVAVSSLLSGKLNAQVQAKIACYNLLNYETSDTSRNVHFRIVLNALRPDVLVVEEITSQTAVNIFRMQVLNAFNTNYTSGFFINGPDTDNAIFYDSTKFRFIFNTAIPTPLRNINEFKILHRPTGDTLRIYACHFKADTGSANQQIRLSEADSLRKRTDALPAGSSFITCGDFNFYSSNEPAYVRLLQSGANDGRFYDMLNLSGIWNNSAFAQYHTQSTRRRSFGNGSTGGLDDRFDIFLNSSSVAINNGFVRYVPFSLNAYGNDGQHYNDSINRPPNNAVGQTIANALHYASDHLPISAAYNFFPSPSNITIKFCTEGYYNQNTLRMSIRDTFSLYVRSASFPYGIVDSASSVVDSVTLNGSFAITKAFTGTYYLVLKGRNSLETWSRAGGEAINAGFTYNYDFTLASSRAYGNNMVLKGSRFCLYSGDLNYDGIIDAADAAAADNDAYTFSSGYVVSDVNGDFTVDASDVQIIDNNAFNLRSIISP